MVKRHKVEEIAGVIEFEGRSSTDPVFVEWMNSHKAQNRGKVRVSQGSKGVRVMFSKEADLAFWQSCSEQAAKAASSRKG
jgi:hypothetical protein